MTLRQPLVGNSGGISGLLMRACDPVTKEITTQHQVSELERKFAESEQRASNLQATVQRNNRELRDRDAALYVMHLVTRAALDAKNATIESQSGRIYWLEYQETSLVRTIKRYESIMLDLYAKIDKLTRRIEHIRHVYGGFPSMSELVKLGLTVSPWAATLLLAKRIFWPLFVSRAAEEELPLIGHNLF